MMLSERLRNAAKAAMYGTVKSVDENARTCDVQIGGIVYEGVLLYSVEKENLRGRVLIPKRESAVIVARIDASDRLYVALFSEIDKVVGLELGADDYVTKPFSHRELVARIRAVLRRGADVDLQPDVLEADGARLDVERHELTVRGEPVKLALKEFDLLEVLLRNKGRVLTRGQLIDRVWGSDYVGDTKTLDVHIKRLRGKIEQDPAEPVLLLTVRGLGYRFQG